MQLIAWHSSDELFDHPDLSKTKYVRATRDDPRHGNGALGLWVSLHTFNTGHDRFGKYLYGMQISTPIQTVKFITVSELQSIRTEADAERYRNYSLILGIAALILVEKDGRAMQAIIMDTGIITQFERVDQALIAAGHFTNAINFTIPKKGDE